MPWALHVSHTQRCSGNLTNGMTDMNLKLTFATAVALVTLLAVGTASASAPSAPILDAVTAPVASTMIVADYDEDLDCEWDDDEDEWDCDWEDDYDDEDWDDDFEFEIEIEL
jgi:hypothetical protein